MGIAVVALLIIVSGAIIAVVVMLASSGSAKDRKANQFGQPQQDFRPPPGPQGPPGPPRHDWPLSGGPGG